MNNDIEYANAQLNQPIIKKRRPGCIIALIIFLLFLGGLIFGIVTMIQNPEDYNTQKPKQTTHEEIQMIIDETGMTLKRATKAYNAFDKIGCGISVFISITYDKNLDDIAGKGTKGYRIATEFSNNVIMYVKNGKLHSIRYCDFNYYANGKVKGYFYDKTAN